MALRAAVGSLGVERVWPDGRARAGKYCAELYRLHAQYLVRQADAVNMIAKLFPSVRYANRL